MPSRTLPALCLLICLLLSTGARAYDPAAMVLASPGTLPLILTVPHDGDDYLGLIPARSKGEVVRDAGTRELAERVAAALEQRLGKRPYLVVARFSRKYLDANRAEQEAMESAGALLIDVHGQAHEPDTTFRGTRAGLTVRRLLDRHGSAALQGEKSILGMLAAKGYPVNPVPGAESLREDPRFSGGYTVFAYGSHHAEGIDAIQLEFGRKHRADPQLAENLAAALVVFMTEYGLLAK